MEATREQERLAERLAETGRLVRSRGGGWMVYLDVFEEGVELGEDGEPSGPVDRTYLVAQDGSAAYDVTLAEEFERRREAEVEALRLDDEPGTCLVHGLPLTETVRRCYLCVEARS